MIPCESHQSNHPSSLVSDSFLLLFCSAGILSGSRATTPKDTKLAVLDHIVPVVRTKLLLNSGTTTQSSQVLFFEGSILPFSLYMLKSMMSRRESPTKPSTSRFFLPSNSHLPFKGLQDLPFLLPMKNFCSTSSHIISKVFSIFRKMIHIFQKDVILNHF